MDGGEDRAETAWDFEIGFASQELGFPDVMVGGDGLHREEVVVAVFKQDQGDGAGFQNVSEDFQDFDFVEDAGRTAEPGVGSTELFADLLDNEVGLVCTGRNPEDDIGDAAGEENGGGLRGIGDPTAIGEIGEDVGFVDEVHGSEIRCRHEGG